jgi:hypothetical protein
MYLDILHAFYTYPKRVQDTFWDTHHRYIKIHVSCALPWCHTVYISRYIRIRLYLGLFMIHDTSLYDTSGFTPRYMYKITIHVSWTRHYLRCKIHAGYMRDTCICKGDQDTCGIHPRFTCISNASRESDVSDMKEACGIHARYLRDTCEIHARYMRVTCEIHVSSEVIKIHAGYMRNTCGTHAGHVSRGFGGIQARSQVGLEIVRIF